ncbi:MAG: hypothetical protein U0Q22_08075 [Acidimicrobiales bacterium]
MDAESMAEHALGLPPDGGFGVHPGQRPALLHEAYVAVREAIPRSDRTEARLATALARTWVYGGDAERASHFAAEAVACAERLGDPHLTAEALDAALLVRWGPDDVDERLALSLRLVDVAVHLTDADLRLMAHNWRLTTAWEQLDVVAVARQLRALERVAADSGSPRAAFFAASRGAMAALVEADLERADDLIARTRAVGTELDEPDVEAVLHSLDSERARLAGDVATLVVEAEGFEAFGRAEGIASVLGQAAVLWLAAGRPERAAPLVERLAGVDGAGLRAVPRDVDFLLTVTSVTDAAATLGLVDVVAVGAELLAPHRGQVVLNAGAVTFHGVVDHHLARAHALLADEEPARWRDAAVAAYRRIGATWWAAQVTTLEEPGSGAGERVGEPRTIESRAVQLRPLPGGTWEVGPHGGGSAVPDLKGLHYLRHLLARPGVDIAAAELSDAVSGHAGTAVRDAGDEVLDEQALAAYRRRLSELDVEEEAAAARADVARSERAAIEREALLDELRRATGLGGRVRRTGGTDERARVAVRKAIAASLARIDEVDPGTARLLRDTVHTGLVCRYQPDPHRPVRWLLD